MVDDVITGDVIGDVVAAPSVVPRRAAVAARPRAYRTCPRRLRLRLPRRRHLDVAHCGRRAQPQPAGWRSRPGGGRHLQPGAVIVAESVLLEFLFFVVGWGRTALSVDQPGQNSEKMRVLSAAISTEGVWKNSHFLTTLDAVGHLAQ